MRLYAGIRDNVRAALPIELWAREQRGQAMVEYAMILVAIALVVLAIVAILGNRTAQLYSNASNALANP